MKNFKLLTSEKETFDCGYEFGKLLKGNEIVLLSGDLGSGKTTFTKGIGKALGITKVINSPTFNLVKQYQGRLTLWHLDLYRLENMADLGLCIDEFISEDSVVVIEWPKQKMMDGYEFFEIRFDYISDVRRMIFISANCPKYSDLIGEINA